MSSPDLTLKTEKHLTATASSVMARRRILPPISREEALAIEQQLTETKHFEPVVVPTSAKYDRMIARWKEYIV